MKTILNILCLILTLSLTQMSFSQTYFDVANNSACTLSVNVTAFEASAPGACPSDCITLAYQTGFQDINPFTTTRVSTGPSCNPSPCNWGLIEVADQGSTTVLSQDGDCTSRSGTVNSCSPSTVVTWINCNNATILP